MHPTKRTGIKRTKSTKVARKPRKVEVKRAYDSKSIVGRLIKLKYRINDAYNNRVENDGEIKWARNYILELIQSAKKNNNFIGPIDMIKCNDLWKTYPINR